MRSRLAAALALLLDACTTPASPASSSAPAPARSAPAGAPERCGAGYLQSGEACLKECQTDADCGPGQQCEDVRSVKDDDTIGPLLGRGCIG